MLCKHLWQGVELYGRICGEIVEIVHAEGAPMPALSQHAVIGFDRHTGPARSPRDEYRE